MKVYLESQHAIRLRLSQDEFQRICQGSCLDEKFELWGASEIHISLCADATLAPETRVLASHPTPLSASLRVHPDVLDILSTPSKRGHTFRIVSDDGGAWSLALEVDLKKV